MSRILPYNNIPLGKTFTYHFNHILTVITKLPAKVAEAVLKGEKHDLTQFIGEYNEFVWLYKECTAFNPDDRPTALMIKRWVFFVLLYPNSFLLAC